MVEENCCPFKSILIGNGGRGAKLDCYTPILTSKSRSLLNIALSVNSIDIMRYLVVEKGMKLHEERDLPVESLIQNLDSILRVLPVDLDNQQTENETPDVLQTSDMSSDNNTNAPTMINSRISSHSLFETMDRNLEAETVPSLKSEDNGGTIPSNEVRLK